MQLKFKDEENQSKLRKTLKKENGITLSQKKATKEI
jgi:hypothetical protein